MRAWGTQSQDRPSQRALGPGPEDAASARVYGMYACACVHMCAHACAFGAKVVPQNGPSRRHGSIRAAQTRGPRHPQLHRSVPRGNERHRCSGVKQFTRVFRECGDMVNSHRAGINVAKLSEFHSNRCFLKENLTSPQEQFKATTEELLGPAPPPSGVNALSGYTAPSV